MSNASASVGKFLGLLMASRIRAHEFHLRTKSYAKHKALENYYNNIPDLTDSYAETYQGLSRRLVKIQNRNTNTSKSALPYFIKLYSSISSIKLAKSGPLRNIQDEILSLLAQTIYKLKFLK